jgi:autotransporter-associated beta strand protein
VFSGTNAHTYTGNTRIEGGTLRVTTSDLPTVPTFIAAGATLDLENAVAGNEVGRLTGAGTVINTEFATFAVNFTGADGNFAGSITGPGSFAKRGTGKQILNGASNYTGATIVDGSGGTLEIAAGGSITGTSDVTYSTNATLSVAGGTIDTPARIRPIANSAVLNITAGLVKASQIDRTVNPQYLSPFNWTGGTVHLLSGHGPDHRQHVLGHWRRRAEHQRRLGHHRHDRHRRQHQLQYWHDADAEQPDL